MSKSLTIIDAIKSGSTIPIVLESIIQNDVARTYTSDLQIPDLGEVTARIASFSGAYIKQDGSNSPTADINWGGVNINNLAYLRDAANVASIGSNTRELISTSLGAVLKWNNGVQVSTNGKFALLDTSLLTADNTYKLPQKIGVQTFAMLSDVAGAGFTNPMTTLGDTIIGGASGAATRLPAGTSAYVLTMVSGSPAWAAAAPVGLQPTNNLSDVTNPLTAIQNIGGAYSKVVTKSASFTVLPTDRGTLFDITTGASAITVTLPGTAVNGFMCLIRKSDTGTGTVITSPATQMIAFAGHNLLIWSDGTSYFARAFFGSFDSAANLTISTGNNANINLIPAGTGVVSFSSDIMLASAKGIKDANGLYIIEFPATVAGASNHWQFNYSAGSINARAVGTSSDIGMTLYTKGAGNFQAYTNVPANNVMATFLDGGGGAGERQVVIYQGGAAGNVANFTTLKLVSNNSSYSASVAAYIYGGCQTPTASAEDSTAGIDITIAGVRTNILFANKSGTTLSKSLILSSSFISNSRQRVTTGTSATISAGVREFILNPASTLSAFTLTMTANPFDGEELLISFGGTLATGTVVTTLVIQGNTSQIVLSNGAFTSATAGTSLMLKYESLTQIWRVY